MAESDDARMEEDGNQEPPTPLCLRCLRPVASVHHYCPHCGEATGRFTTYLPFERIPWETRIWGQMWRQLWSREVSIPGRLLRLFMIVWAAPILLIGLLFRRQREPDRKEPDKTAQE
ncbi:MAG: hypothetical protein KBE65_19065 [Phycisphaerae bacterium]|nr:hypothetical protein [Phycisphaerae bacterium]